MKTCESCAIRSKAVESLSKDELEIYQENCSEIQLDTGDIIIKEGLLSTHVAYLKSGLAKIHKKGIKGTEQILKIAKPGSYIGIQTILSQKIHQYSATVIEDSAVCFIDVATFKELILRNAAFGHELIQFLCQEELSNFNRFANMQQKQIDGRLADTILYFANDIKNSIDFTIPLSRNELAAFICSTRESVTRAIKDLSDIGTIHVTGKRFHILNADLLKKISENG
ncbi:MAG: hypothetical protein C0591_14000 [Marinilabiliales bacterium]|nr:MAG: hypothetical protein C0591_14000 [Marinilabiliales bacterium]